MDSGWLQPGDIVTYVTMTHTNIYAAITGMTLVTRIVMAAGKVPYFNPGTGKLCIGMNR